MSYQSMSKAMLIAEIEGLNKIVTGQGRELETMRLEVSIARRNEPRQPTAKVWRWTDRTGQLWESTRVGPSTVSKKVEVERSPLVSLTGDDDWG